MHFGVLEGAVLVSEWRFFFATLGPLTVCHHGCNLSFYQFHHPTYGARLLHPKSQNLDFIFRKFSFLLRSNRLDSAISRTFAIEFNCRVGIAQTLRVTLSQTPRVKIAQAHRVAKAHTPRVTIVHTARIAVAWTLRVWYFLSLRAISVRCVHKRLLIIPLVCGANVTADYLYLGLKLDKFYAALIRCSLLLTVNKRSFTFIVEKGCFL